MLVLTRKRGEALYITTADGASVRVSVLRIDGKTVRIGIAAPSEVKVMRTELVEREGRDEQ